MATVLAERIEELKADREHGASWMARRAVEALLDVSAEDAPSSDVLLERLVVAGRQLADSRPGIGSVAGAVGRVLAAAHRHKSLALPELRRLVSDEAEAVVDARRRAGRSIAIQLQDRIRGGTIVTHSASATVREALLYGGPDRVVCTVSHPGEEGRRFAEELRAAGLDVDLIEDPQGPAALESASLFLVGADTVFRGGTVCNKIGTHDLAQAASDEGVPTVVACEVIKLAPVTASEAPDLTDAGRALFDLTPPDLLESVVTEEGAFPIGQVDALIDRTPFLQEGYSLLRGF